MKTLFDCEDYSVTAEGEGFTFRHKHQPGLEVSVIYTADSFMVILPDRVRVSQPDSSFPNQHEVELTDKPEPETW